MVWVKDSTITGNCTSKKYRPPGFSERSNLLEVKNAAFGFFQHFQSKVTPVAVELFFQLIAQVNAMQKPNRLVSLGQLISHNDGLGSYSSAITTINEQP